MGAGPLAAILRRVLLVAERQAQEQGDRQLLDLFVAKKDEAAFAALLERHGRLVFGVCRSVLRNQHDAEDAFQATFLILARMATSIRKRDSLASWLYGVALRTAMKARRAMNTRRRYEREASPRTPAPAAAEAAERELEAILCEEIGRLPEKHRAPFVLCCLQGKSRADAAQELGWKEGTVSSRIATARSLLEASLTRRGVAVPAGLAATLVPAVACAAVPVELSAGVARAAVPFAVGKACETVSVAVVALAEGVIQAVLAAKVKTIAGLGVLLMLVLTGGALLAYSALPADDREPTIAAPLPGTKIGKEVGVSIPVRPEQPTKEGEPAQAPAVIQPRNTQVPPRDFQAAAVFRLAVEKWPFSKDEPGKPAATYTVDVRHHSQQLRADDAVWSLRFEPWGLAPENLLAPCGAWLSKENGWLIVGHVRRRDPVTTNEEYLDVLAINGASALVRPIDGMPLELLSPKLPAKKFVTDKATLTVLREDDGDGVIMVAVINIQGQDQVQITQKWKKGECWWREYVREINGRKDLHARFDSVLTTTQAHRERALREDPNAFVDWDERFAAKVTLVKETPTFAEFADVIKKGTGVTLTVDDSLRSYEPRFGGCIFRDTPAWVMVRFIARHGYHGSRWEAYQGGLRLKLATTMTDEGLKKLTGREYLTSVNLFHTQVTDAGLKELAALKNLALLDLASTKITDAGLKELAGLTNLTSLDLEGTQVTDNGLKELLGLKKLDRLNLYRTRVTDAAIIELRKARPEYHIIR